MAPGFVPMVVASAAGGELLPHERLDVGVASGVAALHAHAEADRDPSGDRLEDALVEHERAAGAVLEEQVGVVAALAERDREQLARELRVDGDGAVFAEWGLVPGGAAHHGGIPGGGASVERGFV